MRTARGSARGATCRHVLALGLIAAAAQSCAREPPAPNRSEQIRQLTGRLRKLVIDGGSSGKKPYAYLDVGGRPTRVRALAADAQGVRVSAEGMEVRLAWERIPPTRFASLAAKFAMTSSEHLLVARYCALHGLREMAEECCLSARKVGTAGRSDDAARALEDGLQDEIRAALALLPAESERHPCDQAGVGGAPSGGGSHVKTVTVTPKEIDDLLANPGMGWQTFGRFADQDPRLDGLPSSTCYFRWYWKPLEPVDGEIKFSTIDDTLARARSAGQQLAFRVMTAGGGAKGGSPLWLREAGCKGYEDGSEHSGGQWIPDHDDPLFLEKQLRLVAELGRRYDGHPDVAHVDIGSVGYWGEWHFSGSKVPMPSLENRRRIVDAYFAAFKKTPLVMLIGDKEMLSHATGKGAGWRADCLGDMGGFSKTWNHMEKFYKQQLTKAGAMEAWRRGPVAWETCWDMRKWVKEGWDVRFIFDYALELHGSFLNNKSAPIPEGYRGEVERLLRRLGYRFVLRSLTHPARGRRGSKARAMMLWENVGVAPCYADHVLAFRLSGKGAAPIVIRTELSVREWLPGKLKIQAPLVCPARLAGGAYTLSVAIVDSESRPALRLAIEGRDAEGWYPLSALTVE